MNCIYYGKKINSQHSMNPDPFLTSYIKVANLVMMKQQSQREGFGEKCLYKKANAILENHDLNIERMEYYNLTRKAATKKLIAQEQLRLLLACLDQVDFRVRFHEVYTLNDQGIYACSLNQITY